MNRRKLIQSLAILPFVMKSMPLKALHKLSENFSPSSKMPVLFLGHGSPMNAIQENQFVQGFRTMGNSIEKPKAILCVSAHWETKGTKVTAMEHPRTIHDFGGFPPELFAVQYPAPGSPELAQETQRMVQSTSIDLDDHWGLDHGAWTVIKHMYPDADVPVVQLSLDYAKTGQEHFELAQQLDALRRKGVLIVGSGNIVHNLGLIAWDKMKGEPYAHDWAQEANDKMKAYMMDGNFQALIDYRKQGKAFDLAIPTPEHYLPLLYTLALKDSKDEITIFNDEPVGGSLSMTSLKIG